MNSGLLFTDGWLVEQMPANSGELLHPAEGGAISMANGCLEEIAEMHAAAHRDASQIQTLQTDLNARDQDARAARAETAQASEGFEKEIAEMRAAAHRELRFQAATGSRALRAESAQVRESVLQKENDELRAAALDAVDVPRGG